MIATSQESDSLQVSLLTGCHPMITHTAENGGEHVTMSRGQEMQKYLERQKNIWTAKKYLERCVMFVPRVSAGDCEEERDWRRRDARARGAIA